MILCITHLWRPHLKPLWLHQCYHIAHAHAQMNYEIIIAFNEFTIEKKKHNAGKIKNQNQFPITIGMCFARLNFKLAFFLSHSNSV